MVTVPGGGFAMGTPAGEWRGSASERPQRHVIIPSSFALGKYEITQREFALFVRESDYRTIEGCIVWDAKRKTAIKSKTASWRNPGFIQFGRHPVVCVNLDDAQSYITWLSRRTGKPYRLPSEAEWEYSARAGAAGRFFWGDREEDFCRFANGADASARGIGGPDWRYANCKDGYTRSARVGSFLPNAFGLHDMIGNVWELTQDCWNDSHRNAPTTSVPRKSGDCSRRVLRGGAWGDTPRDLRSASRLGFDIGLRVDDIGFRVARDF